MQIALALICVYKFGVLQLVDNICIGLEEKEFSSFLMEGMSIFEFEKRLHKLDKKFRVDRTRIAYPYSKDYPTCGLYHGNKFVMGIPQYYVPKNTVAAVNFKKLIDRNKFATIAFIEKYGFFPEYDKHDERLLWRGYMAIISSLIRQKYVTYQQASKYFHPECRACITEWPRNYVHMDF